MTGTRPCDHAARLAGRFCDGRTVGSCPLPPMLLVAVVPWPRPTCPGSLQATAQRLGPDSEDSVEITVERGERGSPACKDCEPGSLIWHAARRGRASPMASRPEPQGRRSEDRKRRGSYFPSSPRTAVVRRPCT